MFTATGRNTPFQLHEDVPVGGAVKITTGDYVQVFDKDGNLVHSHFVAGDECEYTDEKGNLLVDGDDPRLNFYEPFGTSPDAPDVVSEEGSDEAE